MSRKNLVNWRSVMSAGSKGAAAALAAAGRNGNGNLHRKVVYVVVDLARAADCAPLTRCFS